MPVPIAPNSSNERSVTVTDAVMLQASPTSQSDASRPSAPQQPSAPADRGPHRTQTRHVRKARNLLPLWLALAWVGRGDLKQLDWWRETRGPPQMMELPVLTSLLISGIAAVSLMVDTYHWRRTLVSTEARENYEAYQSNFKDELEREHSGKVALMHAKEVIMILNDFDDAYMVGEKDYGLGNFSIVEIGKRPIRLSRRAVGAVLA